MVWRLRRVSYCRKLVTTLQFFGRTSIRIYMSNSSWCHCQWLWPLHLPACCTFGFLALGCTNMVSASKSRWRFFHYVHKTANFDSFLSTPVLFDTTLPAGAAQPAFSDPSRVSVSHLVWVPQSIAPAFGPIQNPKTPRTQLEKHVEKGVSVTSAILGEDHFAVTPPAVRLTPTTERLPEWQSNTPLGVSKQDSLLPVAAKPAFSTGYSNKSIAQLVITKDHVAFEFSV